MAANKVVFGNKVLIDLTGDTVTEEALLKGYTAHKADGTIITGTVFAGYPNEFVLDVYKRQTLYFHRNSRTSSIVTTSNLKLR